MSVELREVKRRIGAVRQIHKATKAMEMIAAARLARDKTVMSNSRRYTERLTAILSGVRAAGPAAGHPLMNVSGNGDIRLLAFGSNRGLCGGYNSALLEKIVSFQDEQAGRKIRLIAVGKVINRRVKRQGCHVDSFLPQPRSGQPSAGTIPRELAELATDVTRSFLNGEFAEICVLYARFINGMRQDPTIERLLPVRFPERPEDQSWDPSFEALFEPGPAEMMDRLLPGYVERRIYDLFLNGVASETCARHAAMRRASENAEEMLGELMLAYSRLRQEDLTTEMIELAGGSMK